MGIELNHGVTVLDRFRLLMRIYSSSPDMYQVAKHFTFHY